MEVPAENPPDSPPAEPEAGAIAHPPGGCFKGVLLNGYKFEIIVAWVMRHQCIIFYFKLIERLQLGTIKSSRVVAQFQGRCIENWLRFLRCGR